MDHVFNQNHGRVCTGQAQHRFKVTKELMDLVGAAEGKSGNPHCLWEQHKEAKEARAGGEPDAQPRGHDDCVAEGVADGHVPVDGHRGEDQGFCDSERVEKIHLQEAANERDGLLFTDQVGEHLGDGHCGVPDLQEGEHADEIVHGIVETCIQPDSTEDSEISNNNKQVNKQQGNKK